MNVGLDEIEDLPRFLPYRSFSLLLVTVEKKLGGHQAGCVNKTQPQHNHKDLKTKLLELVEMWFVRKE